MEKISFYALAIIPSKALVKFIPSIILTIAVLSLLSGCNRIIKVKNEEFQRLEPFKTTLVTLEEIPCTDESVLSNMTLRDYRVTVRKPDGSIIIVEGVSAILGDNSNWKDTIPIPMTEVTLKQEEIYNFSDDLYLSH